MVAVQWGYNSFDLLYELLNVVRFEIGKQDRRSRMLVWQVWGPLKLVEILQTAGPPIFA